MAYGKFSRRMTQPYVNRSRSGLVQTRRKPNRRYRGSKKQNPKASYGHTKSKRSVNAPNQNNFTKGRFMTLKHNHDLSREGYKIMKQLTKGGVLEKRVIAHSKSNYITPGSIATSNQLLRSMSGVYLNYSYVPIDAASSANATGISSGMLQQAFLIGSGTSSDKFVFFKNFQTEITITTEASSFQGIPDPAQSAELGYCNNLNFRVLLIKKKPGLIDAPPSGTPLTEATYSNSLFLGYNNDPYGFTQKYGSATIGNEASPMDVLMGKINKSHWQVLQDKKFCLSVPVANTAGAEGKYPTMKKLVFRHPIMQKVQVSTDNVGTRPLDWNDQFQLLVLAGLPNSSAAQDAVGTPTTVVPTTARLWRWSARGFTSYIDA